MSQHTPKKSLGQNFLTSIPARIAIVEAGDVSPTDTVLEIGPGKGFLTKGLLEKGAHVVALEKDRDLVPILSETFASEITSGQLNVIEGDALEFDPSTFHFPLSTFKLIANIPYYITGAILSHYLSHPHQPKTMVVLVQYEVAKRACATDNKESLLSLSIKAYGTPKVVYKVSKGSFFPTPKVDSAVLAIYDISRNNFKNQYHEAMFFKLIHAGFAHKRKLLVSNLKQVFSSTNIEALIQASGIKEKARAEDVTLTSWLQLSLLLSTQ
jgi:16S rRNA (adenine1518-N6/adenine1519-N6)-dimethyltransferase